MMNLEVEAKDNTSLVVVHINLDYMKKKTSYLR